MRCPEQIACLLPVEYHILQNLNFIYFFSVRIGPENGTLLVELDQKGVTMLHVWDAHNRVEDYIKLRISPMIHPEKVVF